MANHARTRTNAPDHSVLPDDADERAIYYAQNNTLDDLIQLCLAENLVTKRIKKVELARRLAAVTVSFLQGRQGYWLTFQKTNSPTHSAWFARRLQSTNRASASSRAQSKSSSTGTGSRGSSSTT